MNQPASRKPVVRTLIAAITVAFTGLGIYTVTTPNDQVIAPVGTTSAATTNAASTAASNPWNANPMLLAQSTLVNANATEIATATVDTAEVHDHAAAAPSTLSQDTMAKMEMPADYVPASANGATDNAPFARIALNGFSSGSDAIAALGGHLDAVAQWYGMSNTEFRQMLLTDNSVHLDRKGRVLHIDEELVKGQANGTTMATTTVNASIATTTGTSPFPLSETFLLHSKPGSSRVLYLNFLGKGTDPAFDTDKVPSTFSTSERLVIQRVMLRVAEDYAAFDVDVTTEPPVAAAGKLGATMLITPRVISAGGYAYLNSFTTFVAGSVTSYCFPNNLANTEKYIGECIAHELGHTLGLTHQGVLPSTGYYAGQGAGDTGWAPIMGVGYYKNLTQWSKGEYRNANNKQDTYATMAKLGLKPRADDHGNTIALADALIATSANGLSNLSGFGRIETPGDIDMFKFTAGAGAVSLKVSGSMLGSDLDVAVQLLDVTGKVLATSTTATTTLAKSLSLSLPAQGTYYLKVSGAGRGDPLSTGYSNYGNIGEYKITGTSALATR
ncbi:hypothetical protein [Actimicrobium antarcticum]|uniref:Peptidase C-terminal archaeal/bacterial domain-containing protein n=1 Tax=Actimicrobium antarcticum TaxID=1051899 RepID=A0ABP7SLM4_9BURK